VCALRGAQRIGPIRLRQFGIHFSQCPQVIGDRAGIAAGNRTGQCCLSPLQRILQRRACQRTDHPLGDAARFVTDELLPEQLLTPRPAGLYCPPGDFYIDPVRPVERAVITHSHADHVAGLPVVLSRIPVGLVIDPGCAGSSPFYAQFLRAVQVSGSPFHHPRAGAELRVADVLIDVLGPEHCWNGTASDPNNDSLDLLVRNIDGSPAVLFTGDAQQENQTDLLRDEAGLLHAPVLKVPHHGGATSLTDFFAAVHARLAVVSVGPNRYGHPNPGVLAELRADGMRVYRTDRSGDITVTFEIDATGKVVRGQVVSLRVRGNLDHKDAVIWCAPWARAEVVYAACPVASKATVAWSYGKNDTALAKGAVVTVTASTPEPGLAEVRVRDPRGGSALGAAVIGLRLCGRGREIFRFLGSFVDIYRTKITDTNLNQCERRFEENLLFFSCGRLLRCSNCLGC
jgi:beta-lactamase superfamily II metal-dependent hydrolase